MRRKASLGIVAGLMAVSGLLVMLVPRMLSSSPATSFKAVLSGTDEVPPAATMATGEAAFTLSPNGLALTYVLTVSGITDATAAHIHLAPAGVSGPVVAPLFAGPQPGTFSGILAQGTITAESLTGLLLGKPLSALIAEINAGNAYVNVHTTVHPAGEIRGQVRPVLP